jgi:hypothetical protein
MFLEDGAAHYLVLKTLSDAIAVIESLEVDDEVKHFPLNHLRMAHEFLNSNGLQGSGRALAMLWGLAIASHQDVSAALKPVEECLRDTVISSAHDAVLYYDLREDARNAFIHFCEAQMGSPMDRQMQSRMLMAYQKLFGSVAQGALFDSKTKQLNCRRGWIRARKKTAEDASLASQSQVSQDSDGASFGARTSESAPAPTFRRVDTASGSADWLAFALEDIDDIADPGPMEREQRLLVMTELNFV